MKIVDGEIMKLIDKSAIEDFKIPGIVLMENAALAVVKEIKKQIQNIKEPKIVIAVGKGNNGGDGLAIARHLYLSNIDVNIVFVGNTADIKGDAYTNLNIVKALKIPIIEFQNINQIENVIDKSDIVVDALLGTGLIGSTKGAIKEIIDLINLKSKYTISVDIPSGVNAQTGYVEQNAIKANKTITFALIKQGLLLYPGTEFVGELILADIGIPKQIINKIDIKSNIIDSIDLPPRNSRTNKGTYGKLMVIGGSKEMTGAPILTCKAAYKTGVGLVNLAAIKDVINIAQCNMLENVNTILPAENGKVCLKSFETIKYSINCFDALAVGPGLGQSKEVSKFIGELLYNAAIPIVLDADALNVIAKDINMLKTSKAKIIITPHPGEMSRLTGIPINDILKNTVEIAKEFSAEYNVITLLKDSRTIIANPKKEVYINTTGNASMSKGGSGDVLTGIISALIAQGKEPFIAAALGAYIHGKAGEEASKNLGMYSVLASDLCNYIKNFLM